jgi:prepilin-type N-terminal cleavage/methylation domain-containing protein
MTTNLQRRAGYTLLELIVVIGIIVLLASFTAGAVFRLRASQQEKNTNTHLLKIHGAFMQQYSSAVDRIKKEDPPQLMKELTKNQDGTYDAARAKAMHLKLRLRQEFPENFGEVFSTGQLGPYPGPTGQIYKYVSKPAYLAAIKNPLQSPPNTFLEPVDPKGNPIQEGQAAAMLFLILSQGQGGTDANPESIAPTKLIDYPQTGGGTVSLRVFVDEWGTPISFRRLADDDMTDVLTDLNQPPYVTLAQVQSGNMDPQDPEGRLKIANWPNQGQLKTFFASAGPQTRPFIQNPFDGRNRGPFVFSAGGDRTFYNANLSMQTDLDNLYSYRLAQSGKGN